MTIWLDNHLSPALAEWISATTGEGCVQVRDLGLARTADGEIFASARLNARIFITKDRDFAELVTRLGPPPRIILLNCGNTSTANLKLLLAERLPQALLLLGSNEMLVEIGSA